MAGKVFIFCAPSGAGKTTIVKYLKQNNSNLGYSVSATTRSKRPNEEHGKDYHFLSVDEFKEKLANNEFIEYEEVYNGLYYGTLKSEIEKLLNDNKNVIFDVDVKGGLSLKKYFKENALSVFVKVGSIEELKKRLVNRQTETPESLSIRLFKANYEMTFQDQFDIVLVNNDIDQSFQAAQKLYNDFSKN